jgi:hypothetical protein
MTRLAEERYRIQNSGRGNVFSASPIHPDRLCSHPAPSSVVTQVLSPGSKQTAHPLTSMCSRCKRVSGAITPLPLSPSWREQGYLLTFFFHERTTPPPPQCDCSEIYEFNPCPPLIKIYFNIIPHSHLFHPNGGLIIFF